MRRSLVAARLTTTIGLALNARSDIDGVFLTYLHFDHVVGFPDLGLTGGPVAPGRDRAFRVWAPRGRRRFLRA
ncbi:MAG: hypothetical protein ABJB66_12490 [Gemmatimonadaceae bacterium]